MKNNLLLRALLFFSIVFVSATPPAQERYLQANTFYQQREFQKAYDLYNGITYKSPELLINMGNAAYELGNVPEALVWWRQAQQKLSYRDYMMLEQRIAKIQHEQGGNFHSSYLRSLANKIDLIMRFIPHKIWELLFLFLVALGFFLRSWIVRCCWARVIMWVLVLTVVVAFLLVRYSVQNRLMGFALRDIQVHVNKDAQSRIKSSMATGQEVEIRAIHDNWYLITDGIGVGWVAKNDIRLV